MNKKSRASNANPPQQKLERPRGRPRSRIFRQRFQITIPPATAEKLIQIGNGSLSAGIERAAENIPQK